MKSQKKKIEKYQPSIIEEKWRKKWEEDQLFTSNLAKPSKFYVLAEYAYPSGDLHMGHWFTFTGADIFARLKRMQGYQVFFPNGFDAFGLPAENAAIKQGIHPQDWTMANVKKMKEQFRSSGGSFSFDHEVITCLPEYYKWNQWIFLKMYEKGLAYQGKQAANWCPECQTVLANEGVEAGLCWRCGSEVVQKKVDQWFLKITDYAERLIWKDKSGGPDEGGTTSVDWPKSLIEAQNNWIGKSEGAEIKFKVQPFDFTQGKSSKFKNLPEIEVFTTRPDTLFGATFLVVNPEYSDLDKLINPEHRDEVRAYIKAGKKKSDLERQETRDKTGVFTGSYAVNPVNQEKIPIWVADYVLMEYGTGAIMAVPAHDQRDFEFAKKYGLEIKEVVRGGNIDKGAYTGSGELVNSGDWNGWKMPEEIDKVVNWLEKRGIGKRQVQYHLRDWSISRQRYWGTPIPIIHCPKCGIVPVPEKDLPVELPYDVDYTPKGKSPLASNEEWLKAKCPKCGKEAERDPDTMDTFIDSSWYFFRYLSPTLDTKVFDTDLARKIMPVDIYFGGAEHNVGHTLYSRFFTKFFHDLGLTDLEEYALRRINHGIVLGSDGNKMSKSKGNVINPDGEVKKYGADAVRIHVAFFMPYQGAAGPWVSERIWGPYRFLERVWNLFDKIANNKPSKNDLVALNKTIKKVGEDIEGIRFNTAVAALMEWLNYLSRKEKVSREEYRIFLLLLAPFAPFTTEELFQRLKVSKATEVPKVSKEERTFDTSDTFSSFDTFGSVHQQQWPTYDPQYLEEEEVTIAVQVNGKLRGTIRIQSSEVRDQKVVEQTALASDKVEKYLEGKTVRKVVYVEGKILNFVTS